MRSLVTPLIAIALAAGIAACGGSSTDEDRPRVVASTTFAADLARRVAGPDADVTRLVPPGSSPHTFSPSARDRAALDAADLVVLFGRDLEAQLPVDRLDAPVFAIAEHVSETGLRAGDEHGDQGDDHGHDHARDPHVWLDPVLTATALPELAAHLAEVDPANAAAYRRRAQLAARRLAALDAELREILAAVPKDERKLVTSHESLGYFADRYGFEVVAAPFGLAPDAQASARDVAAAIARTRSERVAAVFAQRGDDPKVMRQIAAATGAEVVDDLLVESTGPGAETYADALRHDARLIADALTR